MDYLKEQPEITEEMRRIVIDWLVEVTDEFRVKPQTFHMALIIMDKYLSVEKIVRKDLQAVSIVCLFIASKIEEIYEILLSDIKYM